MNKIFVYDKDTNKLKITFYARSVSESYASYTVYMQDGSVRMYNKRMYKVVWQ